MKWLFLVHQVQTRDSRERVKVWRLTKKVGAILYRNSVYVLPYSKERLEDFQWLCQQIRDSKGEASVFVSEADTKEEDRRLRQLFEQTRQREYTALLESVKKLSSRAQRPSGQPALTVQQVKRFTKDLSKLSATFTELQRVDFFASKLVQQVRSTLDYIGKQLASQKPRETSTALVQQYSRKEFQNKVWTTREHIHIDRLCSAWLIKRFIDPKAKFAFAPEGKLPPRAIPFDVFGKEFSHHGDNCTFETLLSAFQIKDKALNEIAQIVHDIDIKDNKFGRIEAAGFDAVVRSLSDSLDNDQKTIDLGFVLLDALYKHFFTTTKTKR